MMKKHIKINRNFALVHRFLRNHKLVISSKIVIDSTGRSNVVRHCFFIFCLPHETNRNKKSVPMIISIMAHPAFILGGCCLHSI